MKIGDLVFCNHPAYFTVSNTLKRRGIIIGEMPESRALNKSFKVLWSNGTVGKNVWDYDLKIVKSS